MTRGSYGAWASTTERVTNAEEELVDALQEGSPHPGHGDDCDGVGESELDGVDDGDGCSVGDGDECGPGLVIRGAGDDCDG